MAIRSHSQLTTNLRKPFECGEKGPTLRGTPVQRWALTLAAYEYTIRYKAGKQNDNADALSRLPLATMPQNIPQPGETVLLMDHLAGTPVCSAQIKNWTKCDPMLSKVVQFTLQGWPTSCEETELKPYTRRKWEYSVEDGCLLWGRRVVIPPQGRSRILAELHAATDETYTDVELPLKSLLFHVLISRPYDVCPRAAP